MTTDEGRPDDPVAYAPNQDSASAPDMLNPRAGGRARDEGGDDEDTDANPDNLNPRDDRPHEAPED